jgi:hypothetical protein
LPVLFWVGVTFRYAGLGLFAMLGEKNGEQFLLLPGDKEGDLMKLI